MHQAVFDSLRPRGLQHAMLLCLLLSPGVCSDSCPLSWWGSLTISFSAVPFSFCLESFLALRSFPMSPGGQSIGASASVLPMNIQDWFPLGLTGLISLQSKRLSGVFSSITIQKHQFFSAQPSLWSNSHICAWLLEKTIALTVPVIWYGLSRQRSTGWKMLFAQLSQCFSIGWVESGQALIKLLTGA